MDVRTKPIPPLQSPRNWINIPIADTGDPIISVRSLNSPRILVKSMYHSQGIPHARKECYVRKQVGERLVKAASLLPQKYRLLIWDSYRPFEVQKALYTSFYEKKKQEYPHLSENELDSMVKKYVSFPSLNEGAPSPHVTGGSVDLTIADKDGTAIEMGTEFDDFSEKAGTRFFETLLEKKESVSEEDSRALENRRLLYWVMRESGFTSYVHEWWHFDYGNQWWAELTEADCAIYGVAENPPEELASK
ncbi:M15 family metallopeptidase [Evansella sp. AB-rgal1]|uniref:M15 family metallopeptidase n=1 Tax=Evansella sp. AB-rgal1 TaxID=3242696 RepID=UPI00359E1E88